MESRISFAPQDVLYRFHAAQNKHDLDAFVACFASDFRSEQPVHPGLEFVGRNQVRKNWTLIFSSVPDLQSESLRSVVEGDTVWAEWRWCGTRNNGASHDLRGVTILKIENDRIVWARLFMEPVQAPSAGIDTYLQTHGGASESKRG